MKALILLLSVSVLGGCLTTQPDALFKDRQRLLLGGTTQVEILRDVIRQDRYRIRNYKTGRTEATIMKDVLFPDRYIIRKGVW